jgi:hypothetical protein
VGYGLAHSLEKPTRNKQSTFLGPFINYKKCCEYGHSFLAARKAVFNFFLLPVRLHPAPEDPNHVGALLPLELVVGLDIQTALGAARNKAAAQGITHSFDLGSIS